MHLGPSSQFAVDADLAARLYDESIDLAQSETCALAVAFAGKERLERPGLRLGVHADPCVLDRDADETRLVLGLAPVRCPARLDRQRAAPVHGIPPVDREVQQRDIELIGIDLHDSDILIQYGANADTPA